MKKLLTLTLALAGATALALLAADIDGTWTRTVEGRGGTQTQTLTLKANGKQLTGTMEGGRGGPVNISEGTVDGNNVAFKVVQEFGGNSFTQQYKGTVSGNELKLTIEVQGGRGGGKGPQEAIFTKKQ
jgi:hypothetical protein